MKFRPESDRSSTQGFDEFRGLWRILGQMAHADYAVVEDGEQQEPGTRATDEDEWLLQRNILAQSLRRVGPGPRLAEEHDYSCAAVMVPWRFRFGSDFGSIPISKFHLLTLEERGACPGRTLRPSESGDRPNDQSTYAVRSAHTLPSAGSFKTNAEVGARTPVRRGAVFRPGA